MAGQFRCAFFAADYEASLSFYGDGLGFETISSWERGIDDRGTLFAAAAGIVEVLARPRTVPADSAWDHRAPKGVTLVIEVAAVDRLYERAVEKGLAVKEGLKDQSWGHRSFVVTDPDGLTLYFFEEKGS